MYMNGFEMGFQSDTCPAVLLEAWTLNTEFKYALGLVGVVVLDEVGDALLVLALVGRPREDLEVGFEPSRWRRIW